MNALITQRVHRLGGSLTELKVKIRAALATELASAVGNAVRDILIVALIDRLITPRHTPPSRSDRWRDNEYDDRDRWGERDPWAEPDDYDTRERTYRRDERDEDAAPDSRSVIPVTAAIAVGVNVGRWWLARNGSVAAAMGLGALVTTLGVFGGPVAHAALAVLAAGTDLLSAESALVRS